jgi:hypothetical protein
MTTPTDLLSEFPIIMRDVPGGVAVPPGWRKLVRGVCTKLEAMAQEQPPGQQIRIAGIKQKLGGLRMHVDNAPRTALFMIASAEQASTTTCERCGCYGCGRTIGSGYVTTLCDQCYEQR